VRSFTLNQRYRNDKNQRNEEHILRAPQVQNPNHVILEEIIEEVEEFNQQPINDHHQVLESVKTEDILLSLCQEISFKKEDYDDQDNVVQTRNQAKKLK
jgi:hypothetical protein